MNPTDLHDQLHAGLSVLAPAPGTVDALRTAGLRRRRTREGLSAAAVAVLAAGGLVLLQSGGPGPAVVRPLDPTPSPAASLAPAAAWDAYLVTHPGVHSATLTVGSGTWGATATGRTVTIARYEGALFQEEQAVDLVDQDEVSALSVAVLTDGFAPEFVATGPGGNAVLTSVLTDTTTGWALAHVQCGISGSCTAVANGQVVDGQLVVDRNPCVPTCADGTPRAVPYRWIDGGELFVPQERSGVCATTSTAPVWQVVAARPERGVVVLDYSMVRVLCFGAGDLTYSPVGDSRQVEVSPSLPVTLSAPGAASGPATAADLPAAGGVFVVRLSGTTVTGLDQQYQP